MSWREDLERVTMLDGRRLVGASFRGVPFFVESSDRSGGRRAEVHLFPGRDDPFIEDLGRKARVFPVEAYVLGDDYIRNRDELMGVLEDVAGPGTLVHPYHGRRRAICTGMNVRESKLEGGIAILSLEFTEAPAQSVAPSDAPDLPEQVDASATAARAATQAEFAADYDVAGMPAFGLATASASLAAIAERLGEALAPVVQSTQELARLNAEVISITGQASSLVRTPSAVLGAFTAALEDLVETSAASPGKVVTALLEAHGAEVPPLAIVTTENRRRERANQVALLSALRRILVIEAARLAPQIVFETLEDAVALRERIAALIEDETGEAGDDAYPDLVQLRADLVRAVPGDAILSRVVAVERRTSTPSLLLSFQLYGTVEKELEIVARNRISHPGLVAGTVRVLTP